MIRLRSIQNLSAWVGISLAVMTGTAIATVDDTFDLGVNTIGDEVSTIVIDGQQRIVFAGSFSEVAGVPRYNIARVNLAGQVDSTFSPNFDGPVKDVVIMDQGRLLVLGSFQSVGGVPRQGIAILTEDGNLDASFAATFGERAVTNAVVQSDGKVVVVAGKQPYLDNTNSSGCECSVINPQKLIRLNANGSQDMFFDSLGVGLVSALAVFDDDQLLVSNQFASYVNFETGTLSLGDRYIEKYSADGSRVNKVRLDGDIKRFHFSEPNQFIAVGCFSRIGFEYTDCDRTGCQITGGVERSKLARFGSNLSVDLSFNANNDFSEVDACLLGIDQNSSSEFIVIGNRDLQGFSSGQRTIGKISVLGNKYADFDVGVAPFGALVVKIQDDDKMLLGRSVFNAFGYDLVGGIIRAFEEPETCFPIKSVTGNISTFCL